MRNGKGLALIYLNNEALNKLVINDLLASRKMPTVLACVREDSMSPEDWKVFLNAVLARAESTLEIQKRSNEATWETNELMNYILNNEHLYRMMCTKKKSWSFNGLKRRLKTLLIDTVNHIMKHEITASRKNIDWTYIAWEVKFGEMFNEE